MYLIAHAPDWQDLTEGGRLCPLLGPLQYIADLVTALQRFFPHINLPPRPALFIAILLLVEDLASLASSRAELLVRCNSPKPVRKQPPPSRL